MCINIIYYHNIVSLHILYVFIIFYLGNVRSFNNKYHSYLLGHRLNICFIYSLFFKIRIPMFIILYLQNEYVKFIPRPLTEWVLFIELTLSVIILYYRNGRPCFTFLVGIRNKICTLFRIFETKKTVVMCINQLYYVDVRQ